ncbi:hypothetical protein [Parapedobacter lycopersici]|uniref:hypothetical protein n=1 Tax=Parapedobacter lycopersici TaxID=1864939 RepID=UPI003340C17D
MQADRQIEIITHTLELDENLTQQAKGWKVQKICGILIAAVIVLTASGLFGSGPLSWRKIEKAGVILQYETFGRVEKEADIRLQVDGGKALAITIPMRYLDHFKVEKIVPDAYESRIAKGYVTYTFRGAIEGKNIIHFFLYPKKAGNIKGIWQVNQQHIQLTHFIYP